MTTTRMTGAMYIAHCLKQEGVTKVFGQCGHTNYALIDSCDRLGIEYVSFRHEQQAVHAADAYYRVSGKLAVINVHLSPGLTNSLTGVATAAADGTPMVVFSGNTPAYHNAREAHQAIRLHADASQGDMFKPVCKRVWRVDDAKLLPDVLPRAFSLAQTGRSGRRPDRRADGRVLGAGRGGRRDARAAGPHSRGPPATPRAWPQRRRCSPSAERPVIFAGNGVTLVAMRWTSSPSSPALLQAPVATTLMGKGLFPETDPLSVGTTGIWGTRAANDTTRDADVILAVGTAFGEADCSSWRPEYTFAIPGSRLIQIDIDPGEIGKSYPVDVGIVGDAKATLRALIDRLGPSPRPPPASRAQVQDVTRRKRDWQAEVSETQSDAGTPIHPARLLRALSEAAPEDAIFVTDVGWNKNGAGQQLQVKRPRSFITSGGMATMGFSPAAAIGAKLGAPDRKVIGLVGDGGLTSVMGALATAVELDIPVLWVLFNNFCFSTIQTVGATYFGNTKGTQFTRPGGEAYNPDFMMLAKAFGIDSMLVTNPHELDAGLRHALAQDRPFLLEVRTRGDLPMPRTGYWDIADFLKGGNVLE